MASKMDAAKQARMQALPTLEKTKHKMMEKLLIQQERLQNHPIEKARRNVEHLKKVKASRTEITAANKILKSAVATHGEIPKDIGIQISSYQTVIKRLNDAIKGIKGKCSSSSEDEEEDIQTEIRREMEEARDEIAEARAEASQARKEAARAASTRTTTSSRSKIQAQRQQSVSSEDEEEQEEQEDYKESSEDENIPQPTNSSDEDVSSDGDSDSDDKHKK